MGKTILILEDEKGQARLYEKYLKEEGYHTILARNGEEGIEKLKDIKPDLILLDLVMPKMGGMEFFHHVCGKDGMSQYPVLIVTAHLELTDMFRDLDIQGIIIKPFDTDRLLKKIETILNAESRRYKNEAIKKIVIVDDDQLASNQIYTMFVEFGYVAEVCDSGAMAIERIIDDPPDVAMISLSLSDMPGDMVALKLQQIVKTRDTKYFLYVHQNQKHEKAVLEKLAAKTGVKMICEYNNPMELVEAVFKMLQGIEQRV